MKRTLLGMLGLGLALVAFGGCASQAIHADIQGTDIVIPLDSTETTGTGDAVELKLPKPARINHVVIMEQIAEGERIRAYGVEGLLPGNKWQKLCDGISIGHKRIQRFDPQEVSKLRFRATKSVATPKIRRLAVFSVG